MKIYSLYLFTALLMFWVNNSNAQATKDTNVIKLSNDVEVVQLTSEIWLHTTYVKLPKYGRYPANGLIVISGKNALMIDLPWKNKQAGVLFDWIAKRHNAVVKMVVPTHSHTDCAGGLARAHERGADSWALKETIEKLEEGKQSVPRNGFSKTKKLECGDIVVELSYLGGGHTTDNIVVWIPSHKMLFGGCLIKSLAAKNLGNTKEADLDGYPETLKTIMEKYTDVKLIVPGHGKPGDLQLLRHTIELCNNNN